MKIINLALISIFAFGLLSTQPVMANNVFGDANTKLKETKVGSTVIASRTLPEKIGFYLKAVYATLGAVGVFFIAWAGFKWLYSGGDSKKIEAARVQILYTVVGLLVLFTVFIITNEVIRRISDITVN
jgi:hypothetical protein